MKVYKNAEIIRKTVISGVIIALAMVLPFITGSIPTVGKMLSPMHIPAYLAGALLGPVFGGAVAFVCPLIRSLAFGMPKFITAIGMCFELFTYAFVFGLLIKLLPKRLPYLYLSLVSAMISGRLIGGAVKIALLLFGALDEYSFRAFLTGYFINAAPSIVIQLVVIVPILFALSRAGIFKYRFKSIDTMWT
jgi:predicted membrane protein